MVHVGPQWHQDGSTERAVFSDSEVKDVFLGGGNFFHIFFFTLKNWLYIAIWGGFFYI